jgi:iron only hydrogenase large subunit-like protein
MMGALVKAFYAKEHGIDPSKLFLVSVMPCTAKKIEAERPEMSHDGILDVNAVLTTRELSRLIRLAGVEFRALPEEKFDSPLGLASGAADIFAASGGVMEAALRSAHYLITGKDLEKIEFASVRGLEGLKEAQIPMGGLTLKVAVCNSLGQARALLERVKAGKADYHFVEVMSCPGGCIGGGGQPYNLDRTRVIERMKAAYAMDSSKHLRMSHHNPAIKEVYEKYFEKPLSETSHHHLHTHYVPRTPEG